MMNPMVPILSSILSYDFSGSNWKKFSVQEMKTKIKLVALSRGISPIDRHLLILEKKLEKCSSQEEILTLITNEALGE